MGIKPTPKKIPLPLLPLFCGLLLFLGRLLLLGGFLLRLLLGRLLLLANYLLLGFLSLHWHTNLLSECLSILQHDKFSSRYFFKKSSSFFRTR